MKPFHLGLAPIRKALRYGHAVNPRVIEQLVDELDGATSALSRVTAERDRLSGEFAKVEDAIARAPKKRDFVSRGRFHAGLAVAALVGFAAGLTVAGHQLAAVTGGG